MGQTLHRYKYEELLLFSFKTNFVLDFTRNIIIIIQDTHASVSMTVNQRPSKWRMNTRRNKGGVKGGREEEREID